MKKKLILLAIIPTILSISGCNNSSISNLKEVKEFKALLAKQDLSPFYSKQFNSNFIQDYSVYNRSASDEAEILEFFRYRGIGFYGYLYSVSKEQYEEIMQKENANPFDFMLQNFSMYDLFQGADLVTYRYEYEPDVITATERNDLTFRQRLMSKVKDGNFQLYNSFSLQDRIDENKNEAHDFNAILPTETLLDSISTDSLSDIYQRVTMFDGQRNSEILDTFYYSLVSDLTTKSDKELSKFIKTNHIKISEEDEYYAISFELGDKNIKEQLTEMEIFPGNFIGTLYYEKESGKFFKFDYEITYVESEVDESEFSIYTASMRFRVYGYSLHDEYDRDPYISPDPAVYEDGNQFVSDMIDEIVPNIAY